MEDIAFATLPEDVFPDSADGLAATLSTALTESCGVDGERVSVEVDGASFELMLVLSDEASGIEITGEAGDGDIVAGLMLLTEAIETAFEGAEVSSTWDD